MDLQPLTSIATLGRYNNRGASLTRPESLSVSGKNAYTQQPECQVDSNIITIIGDRSPRPAETCEPPTLCQLIGLCRTSSDWFRHPMTAAVPEVDRVRWNDGRSPAYSDVDATRGRDRRVADPGF